MKKPVKTMGEQINDNHIATNGKVPSHVKLCQWDAVTVVLYARRRWELKKSGKWGASGFEDFNREIVKQLVRNKGLRVAKYLTRHQPYNAGYYGQYGADNTGIVAWKRREEKAYYFEFERYGREYGMFQFQNNLKKIVIQFLTVKILFSIS